MPRKPRLFVAGGFYHVVLRGNNRGDIFFEDSDREAWQSLLHKGLDRYGHSLHAYCWMTNHVHLLLQAGGVPLSIFLGTLCSTYARSVNARDSRVGHLFERRYRASLVQQDQYLLEVVRYIHLNPVRASIVESPNDYPWSSHHAYIGRPRPAWVTTDFVLDCFGATPSDAREAYLQFVRADQPPSSFQGLDQLGRTSPSDDQLIGDDAWKSETLSAQTSFRQVRSLDELIKQVCKNTKVTEDQLQSRSRRRIYSAIRAEIALAAVDEGVATITEVARRFGRAHSGLSRAVNKLRDQRQ
jgi:REP element-mobilizing transposase RayT